MDTGVLIIVIESAVLLGLIPAFVARAKGRNFLAWWLYGAAVFVIAMPHILLASSDGAAKSVGGRGPDEISQCPSCGEPVRPNALACRHCGFSFVSAMEWPSGHATAPGTDGGAVSDRRSDERGKTSATSGANEEAVTAATAAVDLPWSDEDFARLRQSGPTAAVPSEDKRSGRQDTRLFRPNWAHPRLAVIAAAGALAVWLLVLGVAALMPSPDDRMNHLAGLNPVGVTATPTIQPGVPPPAPPTNAEALPQDEGAPRPAASAAEPPADITGANAGARPTSANTSSPDVADSRSDHRDALAFASSLPPTALDDEPPAGGVEVDPSAATEAPQTAETGAAAATDRASPDNASASSNASHEAAKSRITKRRTAATAPERRAVATRRGAAAGQQRATTRTAGRSHPDDDSQVTAVGELVLWMQKRLAELGYYKGPLNGRAGAETSRAIRAYQRSAHLTPTGRINEALIVSLRRASVRPVAFREAVH